MLSFCSAPTKPFASRCLAAPTVACQHPVNRSSCCHASEKQCEHETTTQRSTEFGVGRRASLLGLAGASLVLPQVARAELASSDSPRTGEVQHSDAEWKKLLAPSAYRVLRQGGTELPTSSPLNREKRKGTFKCGGCGTPLFSSAAKFESGTGWPSFYEPLDNSVSELVDKSIPFYSRIEVRCKRCQGHIGHVFDDGPPPTGQRYCMNGAALTFEPAPASA